VSHDSKRNEIMAVLEVTSESLRPESFSSETSLANDIIILKINKAGSIKDAYNINNGMQY
jgi:hypothetical protein